MQLRAGGEGARSWYIQSVITRSSRAAGGRENAIICLINSNFWWNVSSLVSFSVSALLADYYNKTHLDQVTSIKTPQWALSDWVCHTTFYFPIAVKTCWIISIKFENFIKRSQLSGKKWFQIVLSVNFLSGQRLVWTMELNECFQRHTKNGPDYHHQLWLTKNYHKTGMFMLEKRIHFISYFSPSEVQGLRWCDWCANYPRHDRHHSHSLNFQRVTCLSASSSSSSYCCCCSFLS